MQTSSGVGASSAQPQGSPTVSAARPASHQPALEASPGQAASDSPFHFRPAAPRAAQPATAPPKLDAAPANKMPKWLGILTPHLESIAAEKQLAMRPFRPAEPGLLSSHLYLDTAPAIVKEISVPELDALQASLDMFLERRFPEEAQRKALMARMDNTRFLMKVPDARLRASLLSLAGTLGESAVDFILQSETLEGIAFAPIGQGQITRTLLTATGKRLVQLESGYQAERPELLAVFLYGELLRTSPGKAGAEEKLGAMAIQTVVHIQQLLTDPTLAYEGTALARLANTYTAARLNTGEERPTLFDRRGVNVLPGSSRVFPEFAALFQGPPSPAPGNLLLAAALARLAEPGTAPPAPLYNSDTLAFLDRNFNRNLLPDAMLLRLAQILQLEIPTAGKALLGMP